VVHLADDFRSHVSWGSTRILCIVGLDLPRNAKISHPQIASIIKDQILRFQITMDNFTSVHILETEHDAGEEKAGFLLLELAFIAEVVAQIASVAVVHDQVEVLAVLEGADHVDQERVFQFL
jgi:hypothetical protein